MQRRQTSNSAGSANKAFMDAFSDNRSLRDALYLLKSDWPRAAALISVAAELLKAPETATIAKSVIQASLESYLAHAGETDRVRLAAFMDPFIDGMCEVICNPQWAQDSPEVAQAVAVILSQADACDHADCRSRVTRALLSTDNPLSKVWALIESGRR